MAYVWFGCFVITLALLISAMIDISVLRDELATYRRKGLEDYKARTPKMNLYKKVAKGPMTEDL